MRDLVPYDALEEFLKVEFRHQVHGHLEWRP